MPESDASDDRAVDVWQFVKPEDFEMVSMPASEPTQHWLWEAWHNAKERWEDSGEEHQEPEELHRLSSEDLLLVAAPPRWEMAVEALAGALGEWTKGRSPEVRFVVGPPGSGVAQIVGALAEREGWECLEPPCSEEILQGGEQWLQELIHEVDQTESVSWPLDQSSLTSQRTRADFYRKGDEDSKATKKDETVDRQPEAAKGEGDASRTHGGPPEQPDEKGPSSPSSGLPPIRVLPRLEHCFLRHASGLRVARTLLEACARGSTGPLLIACGSWAWSYLVSVVENWQSDGTSARPLAVRSSTFGPILVPQPFDVERMMAWLRREAERAPCPLVFRQVGIGTLLLQTSDAEDSREKTQSKFLERLASFSLGLPEVALAAWKESLRSRADGSFIEAVDEAAQEDDDAQPSPQESQSSEAAAAPEPESANPAGESTAAEEIAFWRARTLWVQPWEEVTLPKVPSSAGRVDAQVLHSLLLHGGLRPEDLERVLPLEKAALPSRLKQLERAGLVKLSQGRWWVRERAYPVVRTWLLSRGLADDGLGSS